jgi:hypothetical protein
MTVMELQNAQLEAMRSNDSSSSTSSARSSFNLLDAIKRSSSKLSREMQKRVPIDPSEHGNSSINLKDVTRLTFSTISESLSASSEEMIETVSKTFKLFKNRKTNNRFDDYEEEYDDEEDEYYEEEDEEDDELVFQEFLNESFHEDDELANFAWKDPDGLDSNMFLEPFASNEEPTEEHDRIMSPTERTTQILEVLASPTSSEVISHRSPVASPPKSTNSASSNEGSWHAHATESREVSLFDADEIEITQEGDEGLEEDVDDDGTESDSVSDYDDYSPRSQETDIDEYNEEDGIAVLGNILYQLGSCNFGEPLRRTNELDDDYSIYSEALPRARSKLSSHNRKRQGSSPPQLNPVDSFRSYLGLADDKERVVANQDVNTPKLQAVGFFESVFQCGV